MDNEIAGELKMKSIKKFLCCSNCASKRIKPTESGIANTEAIELFESKSLPIKSTLFRDVGGKNQRQSISRVDGLGANPFHDDSSCCSSEMDVSVEEDDDSNIEALVSDHVSIRTRARYTYGLERFKKNAMIIFAQSEEPRAKCVEDRIQMLKKCFGAYRFETEAHVGLTQDEMETALEKFFSRDFTAVGAVGVVALSTASESGLLAARGRMIHESLLLRRLTADQPPALRGKPKIYITEAKRTGVTADSGVYSLLITSQYPDVIGIHIPVIIDGESHPLKIVCEQLSSESHFLDDVYEAARVAEITFPELNNRPIQVETTLLLELRFAKTPADCEDTKDSE